MLSKLIVDFITDGALRERFERDPSPVYEEYGISQEDRALLRGGLSVAVVSKVAQEITTGLLATKDGRDLDYWTVNEIRAAAASSGVSTGVFAHGIMEAGLASAAR